MMEVLVSAAVLAVSVLSSRSLVVINHAELKMQKENTGRLWSAGAVMEQTISQPYSNIQSGGMITVRIVQDGLKQIDLVTQNFSLTTYKSR